MSTNTKKVTGRRQLQFDSLDDILGEPERRASCNVRQLGNWSLGQIFKHLAITMNASIDGVQYKAPWLMRLVTPMFKKRILTQPMQPGFKIPAKLAIKTVPDPGTTTEEGLTALRQAITRL
jgi:hypothetical protein